MTQNVMSFMLPPAAGRLPPPPRLSEIPDWTRARRIGFDLEFRDDTLVALGCGARRGGYITGWSIAIEDGPSIYVPVRHHLGGNVENPDAAMQLLRDRFKAYTGTIVTCGGSIDLDYAQEAGVEFNSNAKYRDVALIAALIDERANGYKLDNILERLDLPLKDETLLNQIAAGYGANPKSGLWRLPGMAVDSYARRDAEAPLEALRKQEVRIAEEDLEDAVETECNLLPVVVRMRRRGVKVDQDRLEQFETWALRSIEDHFEAFRKDTGVRIGIEEFRSAAKLDKIVRQVTGEPLPPTEKGRPETTEETLEALPHPAFGHLVRAKKIDTVVKLALNPTKKHMTNGRIHATFKQIVGERFSDSKSDKKSTEGARFGRMACNHTNMQNQKSPERDPELGGRWRAIYVPDEAPDPKMPNWVCADFSQQEPRWVIHWAEYKKFPGAKEAGDMLRADPTMDPYRPMEISTGLPRGLVKQIYLAQSYNQGEVSFCQSAGLPTERYQDRWNRWRLRAGAEGRRVLDQMNDRAPYIRLLAQECQRLAKERGFIRLIDGRRCRFERDPFGNVVGEGDALNRLAQGNGGVQTKLVLIAADRAGLPIQLVVHDDISLSGFQYADQLVEIMQDTVKTSVPMRAKRKIGRDYAEASGWGTRKIDGKIDGKTEEFRPVPQPGVNYMDSFQWLLTSA